MTGQIAESTARKSRRCVARPSANLQTLCSQTVSEPRSPPTYINHALSPSTNNLHMWIVLSVRAAARCARHDLSGGRSVFADKRAGILVGVHVEMVAQSVSGVWF